MRVNNCVASAYFVHFSIFGIFTNVAIQRGHSYTNTSTNKIEKNPNVHWNVDMLAPSLAVISLSGEGPRKV